MKKARRRSSRARSPRSVPPRRESGGRRPRLQGGKRRRGPRGERSRSRRRSVRAGRPRRSARFRSPRADGDLEDFWNRFLEEVQKETWLYAQVGGGHLQRVADGEVVIAFPADRAGAREELEKQEQPPEIAGDSRTVARPAGHPAPRDRGGRAAPEEARRGGARRPAIQELVQKFAGRVES